MTPQEIATEVRRDEATTAPRQTMIDNAITQAFRSVVGWCPWRDGTERGVKFPANPHPRVNRHDHRRDTPPPSFVSVAWRFDPKSLRATGDAA